MTVFGRIPQTTRVNGFTTLKRGLNLRLVIFFTALTLLLTMIVIVTWEQVLRPPYYAYIARSYPGPHNAENRYKLEQRGEHFFISITVDLIVVSILLALVDRQQRRLAAAQDRLAHNERIATLGRVAAQVAHEVRNPLSGLLLYSLHLKSVVATELAGAKLDVIDKIIDTINNLTQTTEQILDYARPVKLSPQLVDVNRMVTDVARLLDSQASTNQVEVKLNLAGPELKGMLDEASLRAALLNLMLNAVQAMPSGGCLQVSTDTQGELILILISDNGPGMTPEHIKRIFEPFSTTKSRGLGLGMPYAEKMISQHGGNVLVESQLGVGTQVRIELPRTGGAAK